MGVTHDLLYHAVVLASFFAIGRGVDIDLLWKAFTLPILVEAGIAIIEEEIPLSVEGLPMKWVTLEIGTGVRHFSSDKANARFCSIICPTKGSIATEKSSARD